MVLTFCINSTSAGSKLFQGGNALNSFRGIMGVQSEIKGVDLLLTDCTLPSKPISIGHMMIDDIIDHYCMSGVPLKISD